MNEGSAASALPPTPAPPVQHQRGLDRVPRKGGGGALEGTIEESWVQYTWRPWNGFWFAPAVVLIYFVLPAMGKAVPNVPAVVWFGWLTILGVATMGRNREKIIKAGGSAEGLVASAIKAIKGAP